MPIMQIKDEQGIWHEIPSIKGMDGKDGKDGNSGVYQGTEEPTDPNTKVWIDTDGTEDPVKIPAATSNMFGGVKADPATEEDTQPVRIGADGTLYTKAGSGVGMKTPEGGEIFNYAKASSSGSHAEGIQTQATGQASHAEGDRTVSSGKNSHAEGSQTISNGHHTHAEGQRTLASNNSSHAEGFNTKAKGFTSHAENTATNAIGQASHAEGEGSEKLYRDVSISNIDAQNKTFYVNIDVTSDSYPCQMVFEQNWEEKYSFSVESISKEAELCRVSAISDIANLTEGTYDIRTRHNIAQGKASHVEGMDTFAEGEASHAEGTNTFAEGKDSHAEGFNTKATAGSAHAEGQSTQAINQHSHAEGVRTIASGIASHAEGSQTHAEGTNSHSEGQNSSSKGHASHAEGLFSKANGVASHVEGFSAFAMGKHQHVQGHYNIPDTDTGLEDGKALDKYADIVGNGTGDARSNAYTLDWKGNSWYQGRVLCGGKNMDEPDAELTPNSVIIKSSTPESTKRFRITVDDTGTIRAEEVIVTPPAAEVVTEEPTTKEGEI